MQEVLLHQLFEQKKLGFSFTTTTGKKLSIIDFGKRNFNAGPDFLNAKIELDGLLWAGHIEFHKKSSDWLQHQHQDDPNYKNVIAHFVLKHDQEINSGLYQLPTVELGKTVNPQTRVKNQQLSCTGELLTVPDSTVSEQLKSSLQLRLNRKLDEHSKVFQKFSSSTVKALVYILSGSIGPKVNQPNFEELVTKLPEQFWEDNFKISLVEPLLFELSGLLPKNSTDKYVNALISAAKKLNQNFFLKKMNPSIWKRSTMRPSSQPEIKIAQLAAIVIYIKAHNQMLLDASSLKSIRLHPYWKSHYRFTTEKHKGSDRIGAGTINRLLINALYPVEALVSRPTRQLQIELISNKLAQLKAEKNAVLKQMTTEGFSNDNAAISQALLEQRNGFCQQKKCLLCKIGKHLLAS